MTKPMTTTLGKLTLDHCLIGRLLFPVLVASDTKISVRLSQFANIQAEFAFAATEHHAARITDAIQSYEASISFYGCIFKNLNVDVMVRGTDSVSRTCSIRASSIIDSTVSIAICELFNDVVIDKVSIGDFSGRFATYSDDIFYAAANSTTCTSVSVINSKLGIQDDTGDAVIARSLVRDTNFMVDGTNITSCHFDNTIHYTLPALQTWTWKCSHISHCTYSLEKPGLLRFCAVVSAEISSSMFYNVTSDSDVPIISEVLTRYPTIPAVMRFHNLCFVKSTRNAITFQTKAIDRPDIIFEDCFFDQLATIPDSGSGFVVNNIITDAVECPIQNLPIITPPPAEDGHVEYHVIGDIRRRFSKLVE